MQESGLFFLICLFHPETKGSCNISAVHELLNLTATNGSDATAGTELSKLLLHLYEFSNHEKSLALTALSSVLCISSDAKEFALQHELVESTIRRLGEICLELCIQSVDSIRKASTAKRLSPKLKELENIIRLITNFMFENGDVKTSFAVTGLIDVIQRLWVWFLVERSLQSAVLKMLCTFSTDCHKGGLRPIRFWCYSLIYFSLSSTIVELLKKGAIWWLSSEWNCQVYGERRGPHQSRLWFFKFEVMLSGVTWCNRFIWLSQYDYKGEIDTLKWS